MSYSVAASLSFHDIDPVWTILTQEIRPQITPRGDHKEDFITAIGDSFGSHR